MNDSLYALTDVDSIHLHSIDSGGLGSIPDSVGTGYVAGKLLLSFARGCGLARRECRVGRYCCQCERGKTSRMLPK